MTFFSPARPPHDPASASTRWLDWLSKKLFDVDALDLELAREDLPNAPDGDAEAPTDRGSTRTEVGS